MNEEKFISFLRRFQFERPGRTIMNVPNHQFIGEHKTGLVVSKCFPFTRIEESSTTAQYLSVNINNDIPFIASYLQNGAIANFVNRWDSKNVILHDPSQKYSAPNVSYEKAVRFVLEYLEDLRSLYEAARMTFSKLESEAERVFSLGYNEWGLKIPEGPLCEFEETRVITRLDYLEILGVKYPTGLYFGRADAEIEPDMWILSTQDVDRKTVNSEDQNRYDCNILFPEIFVEIWSRRFIVLKDEKNLEPEATRIGAVTFIYEYMTAFKALMKSLSAEAGSMASKINSLIVYEDNNIKE